MARGLRSSRLKANKSKLRAKTFGPVEDARLERLASKLAEISSTPTANKDQSMLIDTAGDLANEQDGVQRDVAEDGMIIDNVDATEPKAASKKKTKTRKEARKIKRDSKRKPRNLIAFKTKTRNPNTKRRRPPRI